MSDLVSAGDAQALVALDEAKRQIAAALERRDTATLSEIREQARAVAYYARRRSDARDAANDAGEIKVRAEHALGAIDAEVNPRGRPEKDSSAEAFSPGVAPATRAAWRRLGAVDDAALDKAIARAREKQDDAVTTSTILGLVHRGAPAPSPEETPAPPEGTYRTIVVDPPWPMPQIVRRERAAQAAHVAYATMDVDEIAELPVEHLVDPGGAHIYLWVTHRFLPAGLRILEAWGARYECVLTWVKNVGITPFSWMYSTEHVLFARAGRALDLERKGLRLDFQAAVAGHSVKPDAFYELVRRASPGPRLEMFARLPHEGFDPWGAEVAA